LTKFGHRNGGFRPKRTISVTTAGDFWDARFLTSSKGCPQLAEGIGVKETSSHFAAYGKSGLATARELHATNAALGESNTGK
jgi:hypothetical protein